MTEVHKAHGGLRVTFFDRGTAGWDEAWEALASRSPADADKAARDPVSGESWMYDGTWSGRALPEWKPAEWVHCFRHRCHPESGQRVVVKFPASAGLTETLNSAEVK